MGNKICDLSWLRGMGGTLCHGCFDILHVGHIRLLAMARQLCSPVIVTVTADRFIQKGPGRPYFPSAIRLECLAALDAVDYVAVVEDPTGLPAIHMICPMYYVQGREYERIGGISALEKAAVEGGGGHVVYAPRYCSSTELGAYEYSSRD